MHRHYLHLTKLSRYRNEWHIRYFKIFNIYWRIIKYKFSCIKFILLYFIFQHNLNGRIIIIMPFKKISMTILFSNICNFSHTISPLKRHNTISFCINWTKHWLHWSWHKICQLLFRLIFSKNLDVLRGAQNFRHGLETDFSS